MLYLSFSSGCTALTGAGAGAGEALGLSEVKSPLLAWGDREEGERQ